MNRIINYKYLIATFIAMASLLLTGCHSTNVPDPPVVDPPEEEEPEKIKTSRTVLVYMVATNNLGSWGEDAQDMKEMQQAAQEGGLRDGRLILYHAAYNGDVMLKEITATGIDTLKVYEGDIISVSAKQMQAVISDVKELAPAKDYGLVLWSHASGWLQDGLAEVDPAPQNGLRSYGQDNSKKMNISTLANCLSGKDFSFIYFDCCYMGSVETLYQLRDVTKTAVAAPTEIALDGMPYHLNVPCFFAEEADMVGAATNTFDFYYPSYKPNDCPLSIAVVNMSALEDLALVTKEIYLNATECYPDGYNPQRFTIASTCYYFDLEDYVKTLCTDPELWDQWLQAMQQAILYKANAESIWGTYPLDRFGGLSTYIPTQESDFEKKGYNTLEWYDKVASYLFDK